MQKEICISYNWNDVLVVERIDKYFQKENIILVRDVRDLEYGTSIEEFAKRMRRGEYAICVISSHYLKSINCMYEMVQLLKDDEFLEEKFCPILVDSSFSRGELSEEEIENYANYWLEKINKQNELIDKISDNALKMRPIEHLKKIQEIYKEIRDVMYALKKYIYVKTSEIENIGELSLKRLFEKIRLNDVEEEMVDNDKINRTLLAAKNVFKTGKSYLYTQGTGKAYVRAFVPVHLEKEICCHIDTLQMSLNRGMYTLEGKEAIEYLFSNIQEWDDLSKRKWCMKFDDEKWMIVLPNYRLVVSFKEVHDLALILDDLYNVYEKALKRIEKILGAENFEYEKFTEIKLLEVEKSCWIKVYEFMREHTCDRELSEWNIFNVNIRPKK